MTTLIDDDYSALGENYLSGLGVTLVDSDHLGTQLSIGTQRVNRDIQLGNAANTGNINIASGSGGITLACSGALDLRGSGTADTHLGATGSGNVFLLASTGDVTIDCAAASSLNIGGGDTGSLNLGKTGSTAVAAGSLEVTDGIFYLGPSTTGSNVRLRWDESANTLHIDRRIGGTWTSATYWTLPS